MRLLKCRDSCPDRDEKCKFFSVKQQIFISTNNILKNKPEKVIFGLKIMLKNLTFEEYEGKNQVKYVANLKA